MACYLSILVITKNAEDTLSSCLQSIINLGDETIVVDDCSCDNTLSIAKKYHTKIFNHHEDDLGKQRKFALNKANGKWVLVIDSDEIVSRPLFIEIQRIMTLAKDQNQCTNILGYTIPFQNHFLGKPLRYGGETYSKMILFKKDSVEIPPSLVHEAFAIKGGNVMFLKNTMLHYSYRSLRQMYAKFTGYALREGKQKIARGEKTTLKKLFFYAPHMFWARFIKDKGYKDGLWRLPLDIGFAYIELLTYWYMLYKQIL